MFLIFLRKASVQTHHENQRSDFPYFQKFWTAGKTTSRLISHFTAPCHRADKVHPFWKSSHSVWNHRTRSENHRSDLKQKSKNMYNTLYFTMFFQNSLRKSSVRNSSRNSSVDFSIFSEGFPAFPGSARIFADFSDFLRFVWILKNYSDFLGCALIFEHFPDF